jgi:hypothetical protein
MSNRLKLAIGLPAYGDSLTAHHARMWMEMGATLSGSPERFELVMFETIDVNPISKARNDLVVAARRHNADWLLMIDADTWVEPIDQTEDAGQQLLRMISDADRADAAIVCAPVIRRRLQASEHDEYMVYRKREGSLNIDQLEPLTFTRGEDLADLTSRHLFPIDACATACFAMSMRRTYSSELFQFAHGLPEDKYACRVVRTTGGKIFCDPRVRTGHKSRPFALYSR